ncbi:hypothetical protein IFM89_022626 [Coptis chinensis]|uniref:Heteroglycan glucosidase 1 n=1 Tax=Coptis chinensis TaxID=261450 RepID=A0A835LNI7_9MAGN|nr:hypothetical protein IFM89_022626 [Coptis chinensis]
MHPSYFLGLSGQPLSGPDIGGFAGNATPKLFGRWMGVGAMFPFCRGHSESGTADHEPWCFGEEGKFSVTICLLSTFSFKLIVQVCNAFDMFAAMCEPMCEEVCRLALLRRYRLIPHIYTLFYMAHKKGTPVAAPTFFADSKDPSLRRVENSFLLGPVLIHASIVPVRGSDQVQHVLPRGIWLRFDFDDPHPDLPTLYMQGGSIIPVGPPMQHLGEANPANDLSLIIALGEDGNFSSHEPCNVLSPMARWGIVFRGILVIVFRFSDYCVDKWSVSLSYPGKAEGVFFEDDGDGDEFNQGEYLLTHYFAELQSSVVTVKVSKTEGSWRRPVRRLHVQILLGEGAMVDAWGTDGEVIQIMMPSEPEVSTLISTSEKQYKTRMESAKPIPEVDEVSEQKIGELSKTPIELKSGDWLLKLVPWIGGRIISMTHLPSGTQWLHSRVEVDGYEEYGGVEYRSSGCTEEYAVIERNLEQDEGNESLKLEGDIGGGLVLQRQIAIPKDDPNVFRIDSGILAKNVGAGSGGYSRLVCLRVHPMFTLLHPTEVFVTFVSVNGSNHEVWPESGEQLFEGDLRPNGEWMLVDKCSGLGLVNRFNVNEVYKCLIHWGTGTVNLELWSEQRPVSKESPLRISHAYEVRAI